MSIDAAHHSCVVLSGGRLLTAAKSALIESIGIDRIDVDLMISCVRFEGTYASRT